MSETRDKVLSGRRGKFLDTSGYIFNNDAIINIFKYENLSSTSIARCVISRSLGNLSQT